MQKIRALLLLSIVIAATPVLVGCGGGSESKPNPDLGAANTQGPQKRDGPAADPSKSTKKQ